MVSRGTKRPTHPLDTQSTQSDAVLLAWVEAGCLSVRRETTLHVSATCRREGCMIATLHDCHSCEQQHHRQLPGRDHVGMFTFLRTKLLYPPQSPLSPVTMTRSTFFTGRTFTSGESTSSTLSLWLTPKSTCAGIGRLLSVSGSCYTLIGQDVQC